MAKDIAQRIYQLRAQNLVPREIARKLHVSTATVKYHLRQNRKSEVTIFAAKLQTLIAEAPAGICRQELTLAIDKMRKLKTSRYELLYPIIERLCNDGCEMVIEFMDETGHSRNMVQKVLREMIEVDIIRVDKPSNPSEPFRYFLR